MYNSDAPAADGMFLLLIHIYPLIKCAEHMLIIVKGSITMTPYYCEKLLSKSFLFKAVLSIIS